MSIFTIFNTIFILGGLFVSYYFSMYSNVSIWLKMFFALLAGVFHHLSMVHLLHDASHSSYSRNASVWKYFGIFGDFFSGHSTYIWMHRHVFGHHIWTNVCGVDPDLAVYKCSPHKPIMDYKMETFVLPSWLQPFAYCLVTLEMKIDDFISFLTGRMENVKLNDTSRYSLLFWITKFGYYTQRIFLPIYLGQGLKTTLFLYSITEATSGTLFGYFSQITHVSETCEWPIDRPIPRDWAEMQVLSSTDYSHESYFWTYISGYLNYQVPHHLFPSVAPHYYPEICKKISFI
jgi:fatty acid desaturase